VLINPPSMSGNASGELPAYVSDGVIGLRVWDVPHRLSCQRHRANC